MLVKMYVNDTFRVDEIPQTQQSDEQCQFLVTLLVYDTFTLEEINDSFHDNNLKNNTNCWLIPLLHCCPSWYREIISLHYRNSL